MEAQSTQQLSAGESGTAQEADDVVQVTRADGIQVVTINRPSVRNAVNNAVACGMADAMAELDESDDLAVGIITGAGLTFCAGMDLKAFLAGERPAVPGRGFAGLVEMPPRKPLIAAVEGYAIAGGFEIALACDIIVAAQDSMFGLPEVKRGLLAAGGGLLRLPSRIPYQIAMEWILTGDLVSADTALRVGLINRLTLPGEAKAAALDMASAIACNGPLAVRASKQIVTESTGWSRQEAFARQEAIYESVRSSSDAREGALAFSEKRAPIWRAR